MLSLTGRGENGQFAAVLEAGVHPHDDAPPDRTHQQALPQVPHKHGDGLFLCSTGQFGPADDTRRVTGWRTVAELKLVVKGCEAAHKEHM